MGHQKDLGKCEYCGSRVVSVMDAKEHTIGDVRRNDIIGWMEGVNLRAA